MTTALYRRYRPDTFADVIGQDHVTGPLRAALRANRVTHAYLFSGPRGCGKTTSARILARCLNCATGPTDTPCGECDSCRELATGGPGSLDVVEIDAASHGGVDDARDLRERATFAPVRDRYKIFIIDEAHMVSNQGFNALLKLVEEPPEHVKFVFATTEPERVIGTIRSRTHHYPFRLVPPDVLQPYLHRILREENIEVGEGVLAMVMRAGGGSVRDTLSVLDQLIAGSINGSVPYETAVALLGYTDIALLDESVDALAGGDGAAAYRVVERMIESGHDPRRFVEDLLQRLRDLLIISVAGDGAADVLSGTPSDQFETMRHQAATWGPRALTRAADLADEALRQMVGATSPRLQLELLLGRILVPPTPASSQSVAQAPVPGMVGSQGGGAPREGEVPSASFGAREAKEAFARSRARSAEPAPQAPPKKVVPSERQREHQEPALSSSSSWPEVVVPAGGGASRGGASSSESGTVPAVKAGDEIPAEPRGAAEDTTQDRSVRTPHEPAAHSGVPAESASSSGRNEGELIRGRWSEILGRLFSMSRVVWSLVNGSAQLGAVDATSLVLIFPTEALASQLSRGERMGAVAEAVYEVTGVRVEVRAEIGQASGGPALTSPSALASAPDSQAPQWVSEPPPFEPSAEGRPVGHTADTSQRASTDSTTPGLLAEAEKPLTSTQATGPIDAAVSDAPVAPGVSGTATAPSETEGSAEPGAPAPMRFTKGPSRRAVSVFTYGQDTSTSSSEPTPADSSAHESAPSPTGRPLAQPGSPVGQEEDAPSIDDENIEMSTRIGLPVVLDILGGKIIDDTYDEGMR